MMKVKALNVCEMVWVRLARLDTPVFSLKLLLWEKLGEKKNTVALTDSAPCMKICQFVFVPTISQLKAFNSEFNNKFQLLQQFQRKTEKKAFNYEKLCLTVAVLACCCYLWNQRLHAAM